MAETNKHTDIKLAIPQDLFMLVYKQLHNAINCKVTYNADQLEMANSKIILMDMHVNQAIDNIENFLPDGLIFPRG